MLIERARHNATKAYCPYSKFHVGAAIQLSDGTILDGCNVENASYGLTICAERNAIFQIPIRRAQFKILAIAIACPDLPDGFNPKYSMPCGACRQVMSEFFTQDVAIIIDRVGTFSINDLLPEAFKF